jgi:hypothetical protein
MGLGYPVAAWPDFPWKTNEPIWRVNAWQDMVAKTWGMGTSYLSRAYYYADPSYGGWAAWYDGSLARHSTTNWRWAPTYALTNNCPCDNRYGYTGAVHWAATSVSADNRSYDRWWAIANMSSPPKYADSWLDTFSNLGIGKTRDYTCIFPCYTQIVWGCEVGSNNAYEVKTTTAYSQTNVSEGVTSYYWFVSAPCAVTNTVRIGGVKWYDYDAPYPLYTGRYVTNNYPYSPVVQMRSAAVSTVSCSRVTGQWYGLLDATVMPCIRLLKAVPFTTNYLSATSWVVTANATVISNVVVAGYVPALVPDQADIGEGTPRVASYHSYGRVSSYNSVTNVAIPRPDDRQLWVTPQPTGTVRSLSSAAVNVTTNWTPLSQQFISIHVDGIAVTSSCPHNAIFIVAYTNLVQYGDPPGPVLYQESITDIVKLLTNYVWTIGEFGWSGNGEANVDIIGPGVTNTSHSDAYPCRYSLAYAVYDSGAMWDEVAQGARARYSYPAYNWDSLTMPPLWTGLSATVYFYMDDVAAPDWDEDELQPLYEDTWPSYLGGRDAQFYGSASAGSGDCDILVSDVDAFQETRHYWGETGLPQNGTGHFYAYSSTNKPVGASAVLGPRFCIDTNPPPMIALISNVYTCTTSYWMRARYPVDLDFGGIGCAGASIAAWDPAAYRYSVLSQTAAREIADYIRGWEYNPTTRPMLIEWDFTHK